MMVYAAAATRLADTLTQENAALAALDLAGATRFLDEKNAALLAFAVAQQSRGADDPALRLVASNLAALVAENRRLLERAILIQGRVIGTIARAVPRALSDDARGYRRDGAISAARLLPAVALSTNA